MKKFWPIFTTIFIFLFYCFIDHRVTWDWIYTHWLYDYHFGFMKRALVGETLFLALGKPAIVPLGVVKIISWIIFFIVTGGFLYFFNEIQKKITRQ